MKLKNTFLEHAFLCPKSFFYNDDRFIALNINGDDLTIRGNKNNQYLLSNYCLHRGSLIDTNTIGESKFSCSYHGWSYSNNGVLKANILNKHCKIKALASHELISSQGVLSYSKKFPSQKQLIEDLNLSSLNSNCLSYGSIYHKANWKLLAENVLESYHLNSVHQETFVKEGYRSNKKYQLSFGDGYAISYQKNSTNSNQSSFYNHAFVYPNFSISNTNDLVVFTSFLVPISDTETELYWFLFGTKKLAKLPMADQKVIAHFSKKFTSKALLEDKEVVENCYRGFKKHQNSYQLVQGEERIEHFHNWLSSEMNF